jgi:hypothetical protein
MGSVCLGILEGDFVCSRYCQRDPCDTVFSSALSDNCTSSTLGHFLPLPYDVEDRLIEHFLLVSRNSLYGHLVVTLSFIGYHRVEDFVTH